MKLRDFKLGLCILFMSIFIIKMFIAFAPLVLNLSNKTVTAAIMQLEQETKGEKDNVEKEPVKEKKFFDENIIYHVAFKFIVIENNILHNREKTLFKQVYHPVVPTPPPNA